MAVNWQEETLPTLSSVLCTDNRTRGKDVVFTGGSRILSDNLVVKAGEATNQVTGTFLVEAADIELVVTGDAPDSSSAAALKQLSVISVKQNEVSISSQTGLLGDGSAAAAVGAPLARATFNSNQIAFSVTPNGPGRDADGNGTVMSIDQVSATWDSNTTLIGSGYTRQQAAEVERKRLPEMKAKKVTASSSQDEDAITPKALTPTSIVASADQTLIEGGLQQTYLFPTSGISSPQALTVVTGLVDPDSTQLGLAEVSVTPVQFLLGVGDPNAAAPSASISGNFDGSLELDAINSIVLSVGDPSQGAGSPQGQLALSSTVFSVSVGPSGTETPTAGLVLSPAGVELQGQVSFTGAVAIPKAFFQYVSADAGGATIVSDSWTPRPFNVFSAGLGLPVTLSDDGLTLTFSQAGQVSANVTSSYYSSDLAAVAVSALQVTSPNFVGFYAGSNVVGSGSSTILAVIPVEVGTTIQLVYRSTVADPQGLGYPSGFADVANQYVAAVFSS